MPFVPVVSFWSTRVDIPLAELRAELTGASHRYPRVIVPAADAQAIARAMGIELGAAIERGTSDEIRSAVRDGALGLLRAVDVVPAVRALGINGVNLFGNDRLARASDWPLRAAVESAEAWNQERGWTIVAAGDIMLDRGVAEQTTILGKGGDYLFDGGTARVKKVRCCSYFGFPYPVVARTGNAGLMRALLTGADLTMANLESAVLVNAPYHAVGLKFTADARLLTAVDNAGIDFLSLANNHSKNGRELGLTTAISELDRLGIAHAGAGYEPQGAARPAILEINGVRVAIIACDAIARYYWAEPGTVGTMSCKDGSVAQTIRQTRPDADVVIVFPHWGIEYTPTPRANPRRLAAEWVAAGADLIVGAHAHVPGGMEDIDGHLVFYSLGNFIFDQDFRQSTMMGLVPEMTFNGSRLMQVWLHPTLIVDTQPNLADPATDGQFVFDMVRLGSRGLLDF